jgi:hypothetical protein
MVMISVLLVYGGISSSTIVKHCVVFDHILLLMEGTCNGEVISIHFILINYRKT